MTYPITTTLNRIWACNPCAEGKKRALKAAGKYAPDDEPITYQQIVEAVGFDDALWCCYAEPQHHREWRLFAVWCARQVQPLMTDPRCVQALDAAERHAYGDLTDEGLAVFRKEASWAAPYTPTTFASEADRAAVGAASHDAAFAASYTSNLAAWVATEPYALVFHHRTFTRDFQQTAFIQLVTTGKLPILTKL